VLFGVAPYFPEGGKRSRNQNGRRQGTLLLKEPLKKDLSLSLGLGRIRLCEALCRADGVLFQGILELYRVSH
jgi:hypothetical protein